MVRNKYQVTNQWIKVFLTTLAFLYLAIVSPSTFAQENSFQNQNLDLPDGTEFTVATTADISSKTVKGGDPLTFQVAEDVAVNGQIVIAQGTLAKGSVVSAVKSRRFGEGGWLGIRVESTTAIDGKEIKIRATKSKEGDDKLISTTALSLLIGPIAFLRHGDEAVIKAGAKIKVYSDTSEEATDKATVYIYRTKKFYGAGLKPSVYRDNLQLTRIEDGSYFVIKVDAGKHTFHMHNKPGIEVDLKGGQEYYFQVEVVAGFPKGRGEIRSAKNEEGTAAIKKLRQLENETTSNDQK